MQLYEAWYICMQRIIQMTYVFDIIYIIYIIGRYIK